MILTEQEREALKQEILQQIETASQGVDELPATETLEGVASLPAMRGTEVVSVPLALLTNPGEGNLAQQTGAGRTIAMSQAAVTAALSEKVDAVEGKGLSTCDYTTAERAKLSALPSTAYSRQQTYSRDEVDALVADRAGGGTPLSIERGEHIVGEWVDPLYGDRMALWEQVFELDAAALGDTPTSVTLSPSLPLEPDTWLRVVDASLVAEGSVYPAPDAVVRIFQQGAALRAELRLPAGAAGVLALQVRYVKYAGDVLTFELKIPEAADLTGAALRFPALKYFKKIAYTPFFDDSIVGAYCAVWALINRKRVYNTPGLFYFHKGWTPSASDTFYLKDHPLDFDNGTGRRIRYSFMNSIWPLWGNEYAPRIIRDSSDSTYNPYVCWDELAVMRDYGCGCAYHNVDERVYDKSDPAQILRGLEADRQQCYEKLGIWMKIMAQPDGNGAYITAAQQSGHLVLFSRNSSPMGPKLYTTPVQDLYHKNYGGGSGNSDTENWKTMIREQLAAADPWCVVTVRHATNWDNAHLPFLEWLYDNYSGTSDNDLVWVTAADNLYEWMHTRLRGSVEVLADAVRTEGGFRYVPCRVLVPGRESFNHRDASLLFTAAGVPASCEVVNCSQNVLRAESTVAADGVRINLNFDPRTLERAERYTAQFEATGDELDRESAEYFVSWLSDALAAPFRARMEAVRRVVVTSLEIAGPGTLSVGATGTYTVTALPADNTQMEQIVVTLPAGLELVSRSVSGNVLTARIRATAEGVAVLTAACGQISDTCSVTVAEAPVVDITSLEIAGPASLTVGRSGTFTVTAQPADNTRMEQIVLTPSAGLEEVSKQTAGNVLTAVYRAKTVGPATLAAASGAVTATHELAVEAAPADVAIEQITIAGDKTIVGAVEKTYTVTCLPENNTRMEEVQIAVNGAIRLVRRTMEGHIITVVVEATTNGLGAVVVTTPEMVDSAVSHSVTVSGIETPALRIVATFGHSYTVETGGVYDADGGYTKIRPTSSVLTGTLFDTAGNEAGTYTLSGMPKIPGLSSQGPATGDDSALYKDYAIQHCMYAGPELEAKMTLTFAGLPAGRYRMRYFLNTANATLSKGAVLARWKFITSEGEYPIRMPSDNDYWLNNWQHRVDTEVVVGANGTCVLSVDAAGNASTAAPVQIIDIEQLGEAPAEPRFLRLNGADEDLTLADQPAGGVTLQVAVETNGTPRIVSSDSRLTVGTPPSNGNLSITVPPHTGNAPRQYAAVVVGITEDDTLRRSVTVTQKELVPLPPVRLVTLTNDTSTSFVFFDSKGTFIDFDRGYQQTVQISSDPCSITFSEALTDVAILGPDQSGGVWSKRNVEAGQEYLIDTTAWLESIAAGHTLFSVLG